MAGNDDQQSTSTRDLVIRFYHRLWNAWDDAAVENTLAPDLTFRGSLGETAVGLNGWRGYRDHIRCNAPDFHSEVLDLLSADDQAAARCRFTGTHHGPILGIPATGRPFSYTGAAFFTSSRGLITSIWALGDLDALRRQLKST
jgi:steroid delta-isomerase-like uncharacterized protein